MANQIILAWSVSIAGTPVTPAQAAVRLAAVVLFDNPDTDPVLGQLFGLTVASDVTVPTASGATRTLTLNMTAAAAPFAPPPFPCHPITSSPPKLPYPLRKNVTLPGSFLTQTGSAAVATSATQLPSLNPNEVIQFLSQLGVFYTVAPGLTPTAIALTTPYTGITADSEAFKEVAAPATLAAIYSTSSLDTDGVATVTPAVPPGPGAQTVSVSWLDSLGAVGNAVVALQGKRPVVVPLGATKDIAVITDMHVASTGGFGNSVGQITLAELSAPPPPLPTNAVRHDLQQATDKAQLLIERALVYLPPSFFALAQQPAATPQLKGDFIVTTGSKSVPTTVDQTGVLAPGTVIQFAVHLEDDTPFGADPVFYTVDTVGPKLVTLTKPFANFGPPANSGLPIPVAPQGTDSKGTKSTQLLNFPTGAMIVSPSPATPPSPAQLAGGLGQFVNPGNAIPPPNPPLAPTQMDPPVTVAPGAPPNFLSNLYTQTLQLALAAPITPEPIAFA